MISRSIRKRLRRMRKQAKRLPHLAQRRWKYTKRRVRTVYNLRHRHTYRRTLAHVPSRDEIPALLNARNLVGSGAEIGVKTGKYSKHLLSKWHCQKLFSIDPWLAADPADYVDRSNVSQEEFDANLAETTAALAVFGARSEIWRRASLDAAARIPDKSLDFVYIDARHDYESVKEDVRAWFSKVKPGGIIAGHDYVDGLLPQGHFGVKSAVDEFFAERGLPIHVTRGPSAVELFPSWIVEVPSTERPSSVPRETSGKSVPS